jgi:hypothetical protein
MHAPPPQLPFLARDFFVAAAAAAAAGFRAVHVQGFSACRSLQAFFCVGIEAWLVGADNNNNT